MLIPLGVYSQGRVEEVIYITQSTTKGIYLDNVYNNMTNKSPQNAKSVKFIINEGVEIIGPNPTIAAIETGNQWSSDVKLVVENYGRVIGRGGSGGLGGTSMQKTVGVRSTVNDKTYASAVLVNPIQPSNGGDGGNAINGTFNLTVVNYGLIAGGGGGGAGGVYYIISASESTGEVFPRWVVHGASGGGGAPLGQGEVNPATSDYLFKHYPDWIVGIDAIKNTYNNVALPADFAPHAIEFSSYDYNQINSTAGASLWALNTLSSETVYKQERYDIPGGHYAYIKPEIFNIRYALPSSIFYIPQPSSSNPDVYEIMSLIKTNASTRPKKFPLYFKHGGTALLTTPGSGGYTFAYPYLWANDSTFHNSMTESEFISISKKIPENHAGDGGLIGSDGNNAVQPWYMINGGGWYAYSGDWAASPPYTLSATPPPNTSATAVGGKAGYVYRGNVNIVNKNGGVTAGR